MARVNGTVPRPLDEATDATHHAAAELGYALDEGQGGPAVLVFKKGASPMSWGSQLTVELAAASPSATALTVTTAERFVLFDWGRGKRAARRLLDAVGASHEG